jgi:hypothetical protein
MQSVGLAAIHSGTSAIVSDDLGDLRRITEPGVNLCLHRRTVPPDLEQFIDLAVLPRTIKRTASINVASVDFDEFLQDVPTNKDGLARFRTDIEELVHLYAELTGAMRLSLKLESFGTNLCERFHTDQVQLRLICSYAGPGTEWLHNDDVDRAKLGPGAAGRPDEESGLVLPGARVRQMPRFAIGLMKGDRWPGNRGNGLVHRSPRITDRNLRRVLFKIECTEPHAR